MSLWHDSEGRIRKLLVNRRTMGESLELSMRAGSVQEEAAVVVSNQGLGPREQASREIPFDLVEGGANRTSKRPKMGERKGVQRKPALAPPLFC